MERIIRSVKPGLSAIFQEIGKGVTIVTEKLRALFTFSFKFLDWPHHSELLGNDFSNISDFLYLPEIHSAKKHIFAETISFVILATVIAAAGLLWLRAFFGIPILVVLSAGVTLFYFTFLLFKLYVVYKGANFPLIDFSREEIAAITDKELPIYTVLIPLLREAEVIPQIMDAMQAIDYPKSKLDFIITLEEYDRETYEAIQKVDPPEHFKLLILPDVMPKTKPKALNVGLREAKGEFIVIYDAEIIPDRDQLKKAYLAFKANPHLGALQTRLDHYNAGQTFLTKLFNAEFAFYYDLFLPGLQQLGFPVPLSGHSTHFRKSVMEKVGAWDPYNVTEDCDVGMRLYRAGYTTGMLNSMSLEEAASTLDSWIPQRTRWMKGFIQTSIVHLRHPFRFKTEIGGWKNFIAFLYTVPGTIVLNLLNFVGWITQLVWIVVHPEFIQKLYPGVVLYFAVFSFIAGNFIFMYMNLLAVYRRGRYHLVKYVLLTPVYWILLAIATLRAAKQMITSPHSWEKTTHGKHLDQVTGDPMI